MVSRVTMPMESPPCQIDHCNAADPIASIRAAMITILRLTSGDPQARRVFHIIFHKCEYVDEMEAVSKRFNEMQADCLRRIDEGLQAAVARKQLPEGLDTRR